MKEKKIECPHCGKPVILVLCAVGETVSEKFNTEKKIFRKNKNINMNDVLREMFSEIEKDFLEN